jgi:hypothetical protein
MSRFAIRILPLIVLVVAFLGCGDDVRAPFGAYDQSPPSIVKDLAVAVEEDTVIVLSWTAPSDAGFLDQAVAYDVRYSASSITGLTWEGAAQAQDEPTPGDPGSAERFAVPGLRPNASYYFALEALDLAGNTSGLSNIALLDLDPPLAVADLASTRATAHTIGLAWTAPSDNGYLGRAASYDVRFSRTTISEENWDSATPVQGAPEPGPAGRQESFVVTGLDALTLYYLAVRSRDDQGNLSEISNVIEVTTNTTPQGWWDGFGIYGPNDAVASLIPALGGLVVGGTFTAAGSLPASRIAFWDGSGWSTLGSGFEKGPGTTSVRALCICDNELIAGGIFGLSGGAQVNDVARWNGGSWLPLGLGVGGMVMALAPYGDDLYAGGAFFRAGGQDVNFMARWDGSSWQGMGWDYSVANGVSALTVYEGELVAGGSFSQAAGTAADNIAAWNGSTWRPLGEGFGGGEPITIVTALCIYNGDLIAAGNFQFSGATSVNHIARWNGVSWSPLGEGIGDDPANDSIGDMVVYNGDLIVGGSFTIAGSQAVNNIARWNGGAWGPLNGGLTGEGLVTNVRALAVYDGSLFVGGDFDFAGEFQSANMARWDD